MRPSYLPNIKEPHEPDQPAETAELRIRYWGVSIYFLLTAPFALFAVALLEAYGPAFREMTRYGAIYNHGYLFWAVAIYCFIGAIAGCITRPRHRIFLTYLAHFALVISQTIISGNILAGIIHGTFFSLLLA